MIEIIQDKETWDQLINRCKQSDSYHTFDYHQASRTEHQEPILIHYFENGKSILLPLIIRTIDNSTYLDATSVYGYAGPIFSDPAFDFDFNSFQQEIDAFFKERKIVAVFSPLVHWSSRVPLAVFPISTSRRRRTAPGELVRRARIS